MTDERKPWDRQRDDEGKLEPNRWYSRFTAYRLAGPNRSLLGCVNREREQKGIKRYNSVPGAWSRAFDKWRWRERAEAWDEHRRQEDEAKWQERREELREKEWDTASKLLEKAEQMLRFPVSKAIVEEKNTIIEPAGWKFRDVTAIAETASKLARLASGIETARETASVLNIDVTQLTDEQLERIARGEDPFAVLADKNRSRTGTQKEDDHWSPPTATS